MKILTDFIITHRERFSNEHNNVFAFSFSKATRHWDFLEIIFKRYVEACTAFIANTKASQTLMRPGTSEVTAEHAALLRKGYDLTTAAHLEIESFYIFAKIFLDEIAHAVEYYFGSARGMALDSHDDFTKNIEKYAASKGLTIAPEFMGELKNLKKRVSDFRDAQIAHEKSPRTIRGTSWGSDGMLRMSSSKIYPKEKDQQADTESLGALKIALENYVAAVIRLLEGNAGKTALTLATSDHTSHVSR